MKKNYLYCISHSNIYRSKELSVFKRNLKFIHVLHRMYVRKVSFSVREYEKNVFARGLHSPVEYKIAWIKHHWSFSNRTEIEIYFYVFDSPLAKFKTWTVFLMLWTFFTEYDVTQKIRKMTPVLFFKVLWIPRNNLRCIDK